MRYRSVLTMTMALALVPPAGASAQRAPECGNDQRRIGVGVSTEPFRAQYMVTRVAHGADGDAMVSGPHRVLLCTDGTNMALVLGERAAAAQVRGCPADLAVAGIGEVQVQAREAPDGLVVTLRSGRNPGCSVWATMNKSELVQTLAERTSLEPPAGAASPGASGSDPFGELWNSLSPVEAAALERRLGGLEGRARRGADVGDELARVKLRFPALQRANAALPANEKWLRGATARWGPGGCQGFGWIDRRGEPRCILDP
jgi:hypothetical protein